MRAADRRVACPHTYQRTGGVTTGVRDPFGVAEYTVELDSGTVEEGGDHRLVDRLHDLRSGAPGTTVDSAIDRRNEVGHEAFTYASDDVDVLVGIPGAYRTRRDGVGGPDRRSRFDDHGNADLVVPAGGDVVEDRGLIERFEAVVDSTDAPHVLPANRGDEWGRYEREPADRGDRGRRTRRGRQPTRRRRDDHATRRRRRDRPRRRTGRAPHARRPGSPVARPRDRRDVRGGPRRGV